MFNSISDLCPVEEYQQQRAHLFKSPSAISWFVRKHKAQLVENGALLMLVGQWHVKPDRFDAVVSAVGQSQAAARMAEAA